MGYSTSRKTLDQVRQYLTNIEAGVGDRWVLAEGASVHKFATRIREAFHIAALYPRDYPTLKDAQKKFRVEIVDKRTVQAVYKSPQIDPVVTQGLARGEKNPPDVAGGHTAASIIQVWHNAQPSNERFHFPQANLNFEELVQLYNWAKARQPEWYVLVGTSGEVNLCPHTKGIEQIQWEPSDGL
jgi:hypothetical protein